MATVGVKGLYTSKDATRRCDSGVQAIPLLSTSQAFWPAFTEPSTVSKQINKSTSHHSIDSLQANYV